MNYGTVMLVGTILSGIADEIAPAENGYFIGLMLIGYRYNFPSLALIVATITKANEIRPTAHNRNIPTMDIKSTMQIRITVIWKLSDSFA